MLGMPEFHEQKVLRRHNSSLDCEKKFPSTCEVVVNTEDSPNIPHWVPKQDQTPRFLHATLMRDLRTLDLDAARGNLSRWPDCLIRCG